MKTQMTCMLIITGCAIVSVWLNYKRGIFAGTISKGTRLKDYEKVK